MLARDETPIKHTAPPQGHRAPGPPGERCPRTVAMRKNCEGPAGSWCTSWSAAPRRRRAGERLQELKPAAAVSPAAADVAYEGRALFAAIGSMALPVPALGGAMKFRATLVLDLEAPSIAEAGEKLNELVEHAKRNSEMDVQDVQLGTAPKSEPVTLPTPMPRPERGSTPPPPAPPQPPYASPTTPRSPRAAEHGDFHHRR
jgi:hypothetical protein